MADTNVPLAQLLLRRKELNQKVEQLKTINIKGLFETKYTRKQLSESIDDVTIIAPMLSASQVTEEFDYYAGQLRQVDALIQQANWATQIAADSGLMKNYTAPVAKK